MYCRPSSHFTLATRQLRLRHRQFKKLSRRCIYACVCIIDAGTVELLLVQVDQAVPKTRRTCSASRRATARTERAWKGLACACPQPVSLRTRLAWSNRCVFVCTCMGPPLAVPVNSNGFHSVGRQLYRCTYDADCPMRLQERSITGNGPLYPLFVSMRAWCTVRAVSAAGWERERQQRAPECPRHTC